MSHENLVVWVEDEKRFVRDIIDELHDRGYHVEMVGTCNDLLRELDRVLEKACLFVLDLWLPVGSRGGALNVPPTLEGGGKNTERGVWMYRAIRERLEEASQEVPILVLSGNLDVDAIALLSEAGLTGDCRWKKPAPFDKLIDHIEKLAPRG